MVTPPRTKYAKLRRLLAAQPPEATHVTLTLAELVHILGEPLPASAYGRSWWANSRQLSQAREWLQAGWRVPRTALRYAVPSVTFIRTGTVAAGRTAAHTQSAAQAQRLGTSRTPTPQPRR